MLPWKQEFPSDLAQNLVQPFHHPNYATDKIWLRSAYWLQRYLCLKLFTDAHTDSRRLSWRTISSSLDPLAQVS